MEMGFLVVVGHFHEADTSSTKFVVEPKIVKQKPSIGYSTRGLFIPIEPRTDPQLLGLTEVVDF